jgi:hypothetical protein
LFEGSILGLHTARDRDMNKPRTHFGADGCGVENHKPLANALAAPGCALTVAFGHGAGAAFL